MNTHPRGRIILEDIHVRLKLANDEIVTTAIWAVEEDALFFLVEGDRRHTNAKHTFKAFVGEVKTISSTSIQKEVPVVALLVFVFAEADAGRISSNTLCTLDWIESEVVVLGN